MFTKLEEDLLRQLLGQNVDLNKRRIGNADESLFNQDYVVQKQLTDIGIDIGVRRSKTIILTDEVYGTSWDASVYPPTKNAIYDKIEAMLVYGLWTPLVTFGGGNTGLTYAIQTGTYEKLVSRTGTWVSINGTVQLSAKGSSTGTMLITNLPFTSINTSNHFSTVALHGGNLTGIAGHFEGYVSPGGTSINLFTLETGTAVVVDNTKAQNNTIIVFSTRFKVV